MKSLSFYEQVGIVTPGALFLFGLSFYMPGLHSAFGSSGITIGGLGLFVIISYAAGHLIAALGNIIENLYWRAWGGMPSDWIVGPRPRLLSAPQIAKIQTLILSRLDLNIPPLHTLVPAAWSPTFRQIYSDVEQSGKPTRGDIFNGNYGLNRGLCAAALALSAVVIILATSNWRVSVGLLAVSIVYLYRSHRFGVHYAREIYSQFLLLPTEKAVTNTLKT